MVKGKSLVEYQKTYVFETKGKSVDFKVGWIEGALATTDDEKIRKWLQNRMYLLLKR